MHRALSTGALVVAASLLCLVGTAWAQAPAPEPVAVDVPAVSLAPRITVRLHTGPSLNLMSDWREGMSSLRSMTQAHGLTPKDKYCICMSWGATTLVHVTQRVAIGGAFEMLRDTRAFSVTDDIGVFNLGDGNFMFSNEAVVQTTQAVGAFYPRAESHMHVQASVGMANGHTEMSTPGGDATTRVRGSMVSMSAGTESRFWYVDAGWRFLPMHTTASSVTDSDIGAARDVFASLAEVEEFVRNRKTDLTGGWARIGLVFHFGHR